MLILEDKKKVLLKLKHPDRVLHLIPTAKELDVDGRRLVVVPHRLDETKVLRNMGIDVPNPLHHYYPWVGRFLPYDHQRTTVDFLTLNRRAYCLLDMGCGKTMSTLWAFDYLKKIKRARKMLVVAPLSTLERTWADEVFFNFPDLSCAVLHGTREKRIKLLNADYDVYVINHDGIKTVGLAQEIAAREDIDIICIDELAIFRNAQTDRWKAMNMICNGSKKGKVVWGLTGSPIPNAPTDAWAQCKLLTPGTVPPYFGRFRDQVMKQITQYKWVPVEGAENLVAQAMQPAIRYKRSECIDLPPVIFETRHIALEKEQEAAYKTMLNKKRLLTEYGSITARNEAIVIGKLLQICCGAVYSDNGEEVVIPAKGRIDEIIETIENAGAKSIVFVPFISALKATADALSEKFDVAMIHGGVSKKHRDEIFGAFQKEASPRVIVAQAGTMSHGLTLTAANTIIWMAPPFSNETFQQAIARISRPGQKLDQLIVMLEGTPIERQIYAKLQQRERLQGTLLQLIKEMEA